MTPIGSWKSWDGALAPISSCFIGAALILEIDFEAVWFYLTKY